MKIIQKHLKHIMIIAGEPSGDLYGADLIKELKKRDFFLRITGIGGDRMKSQGMELFFHINELSVMGVTEVIGKFRTIKKAFNIVRHKIKIQKPDIVILIDYPGFNLQVAGFAKKNKIPVLYYISPKIWAWNKSRLKKIKKYVGHLSLILPFEEKIYKKADIPCTFVGHPLLDFYENQKIQKKDQQEYKKNLVIGLLPGSRESEISNLFEIMLKSSRLINKNLDNVKFIVSKTFSVNNRKFELILKKYNHDNLFKVIKGDVKQILNKSDFLLAASGTVTLEAAICQIPMIIIYKMSAISYFFAKILVKIKYAGLANIIAGKQIIPELIQNNATPEKILKKALLILNYKNLNTMKNQLLMVRNLLGNKGASKKTAKIALDMIVKN